MIDIEKFVFKSDVENNPLIGVQLTAMKYFGYMIFEHQPLKRLQCFRGVVFTSTFILFNLAQVSIKMSQNILSYSLFKLIFSPFVLFIAIIHSFCCHCCFFLKNIYYIEKSLTSPFSTMIYLKK